MSLEDEFSDVIAKAMKGLGIEASELALQAGISECEISGLLHGDMDEDSIREISAFLRLDAEALIRLPAYLPKPVEISGVERIELPFRQWTVNAWMVSKEDSCILFDTGFGERDILERVSSVEIGAVLITHDHPDHVGGNAALEEESLGIISEKEAMKQKQISFGNGLSLRVVDLSGHKSPAVGYLIDGFDKPLFVVGDALFAGSMGRCLNRAAYDLAFDTLLSALGNLPDDCVILPGHGPATTVGEEKFSNPFLQKITD